MSFNPARLGIARKRRLLTKKALSELIAVSQHTITRWERHQSEPTAENVEAIARSLKYPREFFFRPEVDEPEAASTSFRSLTSMTAAIRDGALAAGSLGFEISDWVEKRFSLPSLSVPNFQAASQREPDNAARILRQEWALGEQPVSNMIQLLESKGVRVFSLSENTTKVDAYSLWRGGTPFVFLNNFKSAERSRFDAAHELGHLVLHQDGRCLGRVSEDQANSFASSFLMPRADILAHLSRVHSLDQLIREKRRWRVSLAALCYRLHKLGLLSDWRYRDFSIEMANRGYLRTEPNGIDREKSLVWKKVLTALWAEKSTHQNISSDLSIPESEVVGLLFGILSEDVSGKKTVSPSEPLRLVAN